MLRNQLHYALYYLNLTSMTTVTKRDLVLEVSQKHQISQQLAGEIVNTFIASVSDTLGNGQEVTLRKFGTFSLCIAKAKKGRNPHRPEVEIAIPERVALKFRPSEELKESIELLKVSKLRGSDS
jgi:nucleoid DNA-binding protein